MEEGVAVHVWHIAHTLFNEVWTENGSMNVAFNRSHTGTPGQARKPFTERTNDVKSKKRCRAWKLFFFSKGFTQMKVLREFPTGTHIIVVTQECNFGSLSEGEPSTWTQLTVLAGGLSARPPHPRCQSGTVSRSTYAAAVIFSFQQSCTPLSPHPCNTAGPIWVPPADSIVSHTSVCVLAEQLHIAAVQMILWNLLRIKHPFTLWAFPFKLSYSCFLIHDEQWTFLCVLVPTRSFKTAFKRHWATGFLQQNHHSRWKLCLLL